MNHDYAHCLDWSKDCPKTCFRAKLTEDLTKPETQWILLSVPISWVHFKGTIHCKRGGADG